ncbi:hypothetical protein [Mucilaginibacter sp.]|uniref:hypothetical protein n=1 Tax=Mucilaginibacter sp. TaxID=1882438 RepID=UPI00262B17B2|nr:hypothetical protein [Mucilaginibacter sp.]MDB5032224.1 hypothetical protein [Mucilaginibacter sp.]
MYNSTSLDIEFTYRGQLHKRKVDKLMFTYTAYSYTIYRLKGKTANFDLIKAGKWWQVDVVEALRPKLLEAIGDAIDRVESK